MPLCARHNQGCMPGIHQGIGQMQYNFLRTQEQEGTWGDVYVHYLDCGNSFMDIYACY